MIAGYLRVSTSRQVQGDSLDGQEARIRAWCTFQGLPTPVLERDEGISGCTVDARPGFRNALRRVIQAADRGEPSVLVVAALDRLGRNMVDALEVAEVLEDAGVRLVTLDGIDSGSAMGRQSLKALLSVKAMVAEIERDTIVSRLQGARQRRRTESRVYASEPQLGHRAEQGTLVEDGRELQAIARVRELRAAGLSLRAIAATLLREGIPPRRGKKWSLAMLHKIVTGTRAPARKKQSARVARARAALFAEENAA